ncbi:hypothetical protein D9M72_200670 [compost metagenome]
MGRIALFQRNVQFQAAIQGALPLPAGEDAGRVHRRFLEDLQTVGEAAIQPGFQLQARYLPRLHMGNLGLGVTHPAVENAPVRHPDPHARILDEHVATRLAQRRPAGLIVQLGVAYLEEQADGTGGRLSTLGQRALILEEAFIHRAALDGVLEPAGQRRAHPRRKGGQVLLGVSGIAVAQADAQVHVVLRLGVAHQPDQHVAGDAALLAFQSHIGAGQGEGAVVQAPGQPCMGFAVVPDLGEKMVEVQGEVVRIQAQFTLLQVAHQAAADILGRRRAVVRVEADVIQVAAEHQAPGAVLPGAVVQAQVAQGAPGLEAGQRGGGLLGQRHQGIDHRQQGRDIETIGTQGPFGLLARLVVEPQIGLTPTLLADIGSQGVKQDLETFVGTGEIGIEPKVAEGHGLALGIGRARLGHIQPGHRTLQATLGPLTPEFATGLQALQVPLARQAGGQPARPVGLRQAQIEFGVPLQPGLGIESGAQPQGQRLSIRQRETAVQPLTAASGFKAEADRFEVARFLPAGRQGQSAVQHRYMTDLPQQVAQLAGAGQRLVGSAGEALQMPFAGFVLVQGQLHAVEFQARDARLPSHQAAQHIGHYADLLQTQGSVSLPQAHIMGDQQRRKPVPAPFQGTDLQRLPQRGAGLFLGLAPVLGHQGHELAPQADVEGGQHQEQGAKPQRPAQDAHQPAGEGFHSGPQSRTTSYCSWEYMVSTWNLIGRPMKASRSATLPDSSSSSRSTTFWLASTR